MKAFLAYLQQILPDSLGFLELMVNTESPSYDKPLVDRFGELVARRFSELGGQVVFHPDAELGDHLTVSFEGTSAERILLLGHLDTVFPAGEAKKRPFRVENNRATGPGIFDMKAGILEMWMAIRALQHIRGGLPRSVTVLLNSDEEIGSHSSQELVARQAREVRAVLVLEPSLPGGTLKTRRKGVGRFTIKAIGRAAHAGIEPEKGINAIEEIAHQTLRLQEMNALDRGTTVTVGMVQGGTRSNVVPAEAAIDVDVRVSSFDEAVRITNDIRKLAPVVPGARIEIRGSMSKPPMERNAETVRLFELAHRLAAEAGIDLKEGSTGGGSDGNLTSSLGVPTLDGLGAVGDGAHSVDEFVLVDQIPWRAALISGLIETA